MQPLCLVLRWESPLEAPTAEDSGKGWKETGSSRRGQKAAPLWPGLRHRFFSSDWLGTGPRRGGQTLRAPGSPGRAGHYGNAQLTPALGMGNLLETPQKA